MYVIFWINIYHRGTPIILKSSIPNLRHFKSESNLKKKSTCVKLEHPNSFNNATREDCVHFSKGKKRIINAAGEKGK